MIEVVVAVGIFAIAIVSVIGLLGPINKSVADVRDFDDASRVVAAIQGRLQTAGFTTVVGYFGQTIYASRSGDKVGVTGSSIWTNGNADKFFAVNLTRNAALSPNSASNPDSSAGYLAFTIELRWPAYLPNGQEVTDSSQQSVMIIPAAITR